MICFFFFSSRRRHTRYWRDWSSDVCSSDLYNSGGLDITYLGFAEIDSMGNINVSRFGDRIGGCGGFIDITQSTKKIVFCGTMTAGGLKVGVKDGRLDIVNEGKKIKFKRSEERRVGKECRSRWS